MYRPLLAVLFTAIIAQAQKDALLASKANNEFSLDLLKNIAEKQNGANVFFSPYSISNAIAMTSLGAKGITLKEIEEAFHFDELQGKSEEAVHLAYKTMNDEYNKGNNNFTLSTANKLYGSNVLDVEETFRTDVQKYYDAGIETVNFGSGSVEQMINRWVENRTNNKIKNLFKPRSFNSDTVLVLVNAIYFKGTWQTSFNEKSTRDETFRTSETSQKQVKMMTQTKAKIKYYEDSALKAKVALIPYTGNKLNMVIVLPDEVNGISEVLKGLKASSISSLLSKVTNVNNVYLKIPKFKLETEYSLRPELEDLGVKNLFTDGADLTGIFGKGGTKVNAVIHKAFIEVNEKGTEAAAATGIHLVATAAIGNVEQFQFIVDRPFYFAIIDETYQNILFNGLMYDP